MLRRLFFLVVYFFFSVCQADVPAQETSTVAAEVPAQEPSRALAADLKNFIETDADFKQRCDVEDEELRYLFDAVDREIMIAQKEKTGPVSDDAREFYNGVASVYQEELKGLILLPYEKIPHIHAVVKELAERYSMPIPPIFLAGDETLFNAKAASYTQGVALVVLGRKLVEYMNDDELKIVLAHELAHIKNGHVLKAVGARAITVGMLIVLSLYVHHKIQPLRDALRESMNSLTRCGALLTIVLAGGIIRAAVTRGNEQEADIYAMVVTKDPDAFVAAMKSMSGYAVGQLTKFLDDYELLLKKIDVLKALNPEAAATMLDVAQTYGREFVAATRSILEEDGGTHPSMKTRIAYGQLVADHKDILQPKA